MILGNTGDYYVIALPLSLLLFPFSRFCVEKITLMFILDYRFFPGNCR